MLGLSPLTASPLGDDAPESEGEGAGEQNFAFLQRGPIGALVLGGIRNLSVAAADQVDLTASSIVTGAPVLGEPTASVVDALSASSIVTGAPVVASADLSAQHALTASSIVTGTPALGEPTASVVGALSANGVVTGRPVITGEIDTPGSIDAYARALQAAGLDNATSPRFQFSPDGTKYFVKPNGEGVGRPPQRYDLTTPWDVATGTLVNANGFNITTTNIIQDFQLSDDGLYIAFLMWANSDGKSAIHLYSLAQAFVTNYTGTSSSAGSDDGYTFVRSFIIDQGYRRIKAFRHFDGRLYTVDAPLTQNSTLQRRAVTNALFSSLGLSSNATVLASTLTTTVTGYSIAFLSLDGSSRIYHSNASCDPLTLAQLEVSGQTLGFNLRYQLKPDGIGIVVPQLAEIDTDTSVTISQFGAIGAFDVVTGQPVVAEAAMAQQSILAPVALLTGSPVIGQTAYTQSSALSADAIATGDPVVADTGIGQDHQAAADGIVTGQPVLQTTTAVGVNNLSADVIVTGAPDLGLGPFSQHVVVDVVGVEASGVAGAIAVTGAAETSAAGVEASGVVDVVTAAGTEFIVVDVVGVEVSSVVGSVIAAAGAETSAAGVEASGAVGATTVAGTEFVAVDVAGVEAAGVADAVAVAGNATFAVEGVQGAGQVGTAAATQTAGATVVGVAAQGQAGQVSIVGSSAAVVVGVVAQGQAGIVIPRIGSFAGVTGVAATGSAAELSVTADAHVPVTGVATQGNVGQVAAGGSGESTAVLGVAEGQVGAATVRIGIFASVTGVAAIGAAGELAAPIGVSIAVVGGVVAEGRVGRVVVWGSADVNPTPSNPWSVLDESGTGGSVAWGPAAPDPVPAPDNPWSTLAA